MVKMWVRLIENGAKTFDEVPQSLKPAVKQILIEDGYWSETH